MIDVNISGTIYTLPLYLLIAIIGRAIWILHYLKLCTFNDLGAPLSQSSANRPKPWGRLKRGLTQSSALVSATTPAGDISQAHLKWVAKTQRQFDVSVLGGAIALAAWTQLFTSSDSEPASSLSRQTMTLLFVGATLLIAGPFVAEKEGRHFTYLVRESAVRIGFTAILLALCSLTIDVAAPPWPTTAHIAAVLVVLCDLTPVVSGCRVHTLAARRQSRARPS
jgi:hypothetical protein